MPRGAPIAILLDVTRLCSWLVRSLPFAFLASVVAAGCSHDPNAGGSDDSLGETEVPRERDSGASLPPVKEPETDAGATDAAPARQCPAPAPTTYRPWKAPPAKQSGRCNSGDITFFNQNLESMTGADLEAAMRARSTNCGACIYSLESDATWTPMVKLADGSYLRNFGACFARRQNGTNACGEAIHVEQACLIAVCDGCPGTQFDSCTQTAMSATGNCSAPFTNFESLCANSNGLYSECLTIGEGIGLLCGGL